MCSRNMFSDDWIVPLTSWCLHELHTGFLRHRPFISSMSRMSSSPIPRTSPVTAENQASNTNTRLVHTVVPSYLSISLFNNQLQESSRHVAGWAVTRAATASHHFCWDSFARHGIGRERIIGSCLPWQLNMSLGLGLQCGWVEYRQIYIYIIIYI
jgi:hypothetical protein